LVEISQYPNGVGCSDGLFGPGTTVYAGRAGTVTKIQSAWFQFSYFSSNYGSNIYVNLYHEQKVMKDPATGQPIAVGAQVSLGEPLVMVGNLGNSTGCHLHFEINIGWDGIGGGGSGYDINPSNYLAAAPRMDIVLVGGDLQLYHKYWTETGDDLCAACGYLSIPPPQGVSGFVSDPGTTWWMANSRMDIYAEGTDGNLWQYWWQNGQGGWAPMGAYPPGTIGSDTPAVAAPPSGARIDLFVIRGGQVFWKHWSDGAGPPLPDCFANGCWSSLPTAPVSLVSHPAAMWFNQGTAPTLYVLAEGNNHQAYAIWFQNSAWSQWTVLGPYPNYPPAQYSAGPAAAAWPDGSRLDEYVTDNNGFENFKFYTPSGGCWANCTGTQYPFGWYPLGSQYGQPKLAVSDPAIGWWPWYFLRRIDLYFQDVNGELRGRYYESDGTNSWNVDFGPWAAGSILSSASAPALAVWRCDPRSALNTCPS
jgi:hypothetical protein